MRLLSLFRLPSGMSYLVHKSLLRWLSDNSFFAQDQIVKFEVKTVTSFSPEVLARYCGLAFWMTG